MIGYKSSRHSRSQSEVKPKPIASCSQNVFLRLALATCICFEFWLVHWIVCLYCDWPEWLLWFNDFGLDEKCSIFPPINLEWYRLWTKPFFNPIKGKCIFFQLFFSHLHGHNVTEAPKETHRKWRQRLQHSSLTITIQSLMTTKPAIAAQNNRFNKRK